jgi:hypothetical protein
MPALHDPQLDLPPTHEMSWPSFERVAAPKVELNRAAWFWPTGPLAQRMQLDVGVRDRLHTLKIDVPGINAAQPSIT